ncbi:cbb3-type cytochrome c oxidase N-terminal domain-containing protein [Arsenicibacter rosenii]|uniref:Cytochrome c domain-containing protein n=1 Tax=Arsenicibacter rosenii TaxID=1750698 RepID=A0A1S2VMW2_9BACT|nr:cbb3-type cytochrome c oxidase N-terminal domain-containing protein [Arsenicibacter rosenii]OIN60111.1 hypothetical protein BLX24_04495 [Arsenicibacter rosenii]
MKFRHYLETITGVSVYPMFSLLLFVAFFMILLWMVFRMTRREVNGMKNIPFQANLLPLLLLTAEAPGTEEFVQYMLLALLLIVALFVIGLLVAIVALMRKIIGVNEPTADTATAFAEPEGNGLSRWWKRFGGVNYAISEEHKLMMQDHEYDGIMELDNRMPPWLQFLFSTTIIFALIYLVHYHIAQTGDLQLAELDKTMQVASAEKEEYLKKVAAKINENTVTPVTDKGQLAEAKTLFEQKCAACHGAQGQGGVGPNLTDEYWLHGGGIHNVFKTIKYGVPDKGMIAWQNQMTPLDIQKIASYVLTIKGTNPPNAKAPQGEAYKEGAAKEVALK